MPHPEIPTNVLLATPSLQPEVGGPAYTVSAIARYLAERGVTPRFLTAEKAAWFLRLAHVREVHEADVVHSFGIWSPLNHWSARSARVLGRPWICCPMGMLDPWALKQKPWKKHLGWRAYQRADIARAAVVHTTAESEAEHLRALGIETPIALIPHGVEAPADLPLRGERPSAGGTALFLSRIHPKKGLLDLVEAWARVRPRDWRMIIAGPDEGGHQQQVEQAIAQRGLRDVFYFAGPVYGEQKRNLLFSADLFLLPTYSENFGHVIPEALVHGVPVITTTGAPWRELIETRSGWWVEPGVEGISRALAEATQAKAGELREMGLRGRSMVLARYSWAAAISKYLELYSWVLDRGPKPRFVEG